MKDLAEDPLVLPEYVESKFINASSGKLASEDEPGAITEYFINQELTPEYALMRKLYPYIDGLDQSEISALEEFETNSELNIEAIQDENLFGEPPLLDPNERIIEDEEDTEGLF